MPKRVDTIDIEVGRRLKSFRLNKDLSQAKLADKLGITFQQVQKYESGTNRVGASRLFHLSSILEVQVGDFFSRL